MSENACGVDELGRLRETYHAAIQHDLVDLTGEERFVGIVRRPTPWFAGAVDENIPSLGPPAELLDEFKQRVEDMKIQGLCEEGAHNAAWDEIDVERRYREHLTSDAEAQQAMDDLLATVEDGQDVVLVCFEAENKQCHRHVLKDVLKERLANE